MHENGIEANPVITIAGSDGISLGGQRPGDVIAPGYQHLDVLTAATVQNDGRPEPVSVHLAEFTGAATD